MNDSNPRMLNAITVHGQRKLSNEGYRTRDGHMIEWFSKSLPNDSVIRVISRPEPALLKATGRLKYDRNAAIDRTVPVDTTSLRIPSPWNPKKWWVTSARDYPEIPRGSGPTFIWNPMYGLSSSFAKLAHTNSTVAFDLLDDWTVHHHFIGFSQEVDAAYRAIFSRADIVSANSEATVQLAQRYGRQDVHFIPNGCDPERFSTNSTAQGCPTVGYVGKIGKRLDVKLIREVVTNLPDFRFVFAGPVLDPESGNELSKLPRTRLLGDVHYRDVPSLLQTFDIGWVPHNVGEFEVGGDVIKTYEYRASGLPSVTTPLIGTGKRGLKGLFVAKDAKETVAVFREFIRENGRADRIPETISTELTWKYKAQLLLSMTGVR